MPPRLYSRFSFVKQVDDGGNPKTVLLSSREKFYYRDLADNEVYTVEQGDRLTDLAARKYAALDDPPDFYADWLWWVIADFQPRPIHDPTIVLTPGQRLIIPSLRTVQSLVFNEGERR